MNTVFLPATHAPQKPGNAATRQKPDSANNADDTNGFANVLADQASASSAPAQARGSQPSAPSTANKDGPGTAKEAASTTKALASQSTRGLVQSAHIEDVSSIRKHALPAEFQKILASLPNSNRSAIGNELDQAKLAPAWKGGKHQGNIVLTTPPQRLHVQQQADEPIRLAAMSTDSLGHLADRNQGLPDTGNMLEIRRLNPQTGASESKNRHLSANLSSHGPKKLDGQMRTETRSLRAETAALIEEPAVDPTNKSTLLSNAAAISEKAVQHSATTHSETMSSHASGHLVTPLAESQAHITLKPDSIERPLSSPQWATNLGQQFSSMVRQAGPGRHIAELRLDPPQLGPLRITINLNDTVVQAVFTSAHLSVRNAVEQALPLLQQQLEQEGLSLGQTSVGDHSQGSQTNHPEHSGGSVLADASKTAFTDDDLSVTSGHSAPVYQPAADALVDTFV